MPLLQDGLAEKAPYLIHEEEEEVQRSGIRVEQSFQGTRWNSIYGYGVRRTTGRGEGSSELCFDLILSENTK